MPSIWNIKCIFILGLKYIGCEKIRQLFLLLPFIFLRPRVLKKKDCKNGNRIYRFIVLNTFRILHYNMVQLHNVCAYFEICVVRSLVSNFCRLGDYLRNVCLR